MSAFDERRKQDLQKLEDLQAQSGKRIRVLAVSGEPPNAVTLELHYKTAPSKNYPRAIQDVTRLTISLPARYPFVEPSVNIQTPILHPNVFDSGRICLGIKWVPSFGLELLVRRVVQIITFDPAILNEASPANGAALAWYRQAINAHPNAFPTDAFVLQAAEPSKKIKWQNMDAKTAKAVIACPGCSAKLSLPSGKRGRVRCPKCGNQFEAAT